MQIQRNSILVAFSTCLITLIASIVITCISSNFVTEWFTFLISLTISIFASALLVLIISIISLANLKSHAVQDYIQLLSDIIETQSVIGLLLQDNKLPNGKFKLNKDQLIAIDKLFESLIKMQKQFIKNDKLAWPLPMIFVRLLSKKRKSAYYVEANILVNMFYALEKCVDCHTHLSEIRFLDGEKQQSSIKAFVKSWNELNAYYKKGGLLEIHFDPYMENLRNIQ